MFGTSARSPALAHILEAARDRVGRYGFDRATLADIATDINNIPAANCLNRCRRSVYTESKQMRATRIF